MSDLTWQQMQTAATSLGLPNDLFTVVNGEVVIRVSALFGTPVANLSTSGVVEALHEIREVAAKAQETFNQGRQVGERLAAFPQSTFGTPVGGFVLQAGMIYVRRPLASTGIIGATN